MANEFKIKKGLIVDGDSTFSGSLESTQDITASAFLGDGSALTGITASPAGSDTEIQFNNAGALGASANLTFDGTDLTLGSGGYIYGDTTAPYLRLNNASGAFLGYNTSNISIGGPITVTDSGTNVFRFRNNKVISTQPLFIGTSNINDTPTAELQVKGSGATSATTALLIENSAGTDLFKVEDGGNVGIGTTSPAEKLTVDGTFSSNALWTDSSNISYWGSYSTAYGGLTWNTGLATIYATSGNKLNLAANGSSPDVTIDTSGNVGIGTTSPNSGMKLEVVGNIRTNVSNGKGFAITGTTGVTSGLVRSDGAGVALRTSDTDRVTVDLNGNVGIGTSSPSTKLYIEDDLGAAGTFLTLSNSNSTYLNNYTIGTTNKVLKVSGGGSSQDGVLFEDTLYVGMGSNTNVGIGTSSPNANLEVASLDATGTKAIIRLTSKDLSVIDEQELSEIQFFNSDADGSHVSAYIKNIAAEQYGRKGQLALGTSQTNATNAVEAMRIDENGNVGIGETSPDFKLETTVTESSPSDFITPFSIKRSYATSSTTDMYTGMVWRDVNTIQAGIYANRTNSANNYESDLNFYTNAGSSNMTPATALSTAKMTILAAGNVGIGTSTPGQKLHVDGNIRVGNSADVIYSNRFYSLSNADVLISSNSGYAITFNEGASERMRITSGGDVGIGTTSPSSKLHIFDTGYPQMALQSNGGTWQVGVSTGNDLAFRKGTSGSDYPLWLDSSSNIGVGTTSPAEKLTVEGNISGSGDVNIIGDVTASAFVGDGSALTGITASPAGSDTQLQFNNAGTLGASAGLTYNENTDLFVSGTLTVQLPGQTGNDFEINNVGSNTHEITGGNKLSIDYPITDMSNTATFAHAAGTKYVSIGASTNLGGRLNVKGFGTTSATTALLVEDSAGTDLLKINDDGFIYGNSTVNFGHSINIERSGPSISFKTTNNAVASGFVFQNSGGSTTARIYHTPDTGKIDFWPSNGGSKMNLTTTGLELTGSLTVSGSSVDLKTYGDIDLYAPGDLLYGKVNASSEGLNLDTVANRHMIFKKAGSEIMRINTDGNVGIGTTSPDANLQVAGDFRLGDGSYTSIDFNADPSSHQGNGGLEIKPSTVPGSGTANWYTRFASNVSTGTTNHNVTVDGDVGIGTSSPDAKLEISDATDNNLRIGTRGGNMNLFSTTDAGAGAPLAFESSQFHFITGNVGIGTTSPAEKLTVEGNISGSGDINIVGDVTASAFVGDGSALTGITATDNTKLPLAGGTMTGNLKLNDNNQLQLGTDADLVFYSDNTQTLMHNYNNDLIIKQDATDGDIRFQSDDGSGGTVEYFRLDGGLVNTVISKDFRFEDNVKGTFGSSQDLEIYHDGSNSYIADTGTGTLNISSNQINLNASNGENGIQINENADVKIRYDNSVKLQTTSTGVEVTGDITASGDLTLDDGSGASPSLYFKNQADNFWRYLMETGGDLSIKEGTSTRLTYQAGGNVGIGTSTPAEKLTVSGDANVTGKLAVGSASTHPSYAFYNQSNAYFNGSVIIDDTLNQTGGGTSTFSGNVGVGTTSMAARLNVKGSGATSSTTALLVENSSGTDLFKVEDGGNVGIGTTSTTSKLNVDGGISTSGTSGDIDSSRSFILSTLGTNRGGIYSDQILTGDVGRSLDDVVAYSANGTFGITVGTTTNKVLTVSGSSVGIGTETPDKELHVVGSAKITGGVTGSSFTGSFVGDGSGLTGIGGGTPGGSTGEVQFNDNGNFSGDSGLVYDAVSSTLTVGTAISMNAVLKETYTATSLPASTPNVIAALSYNGISRAGMFFDYVVVEAGGDMRAGTVMVASNGTNITSTDNSTADIGSTTGVTWSAAINSGNQTIELTLTTPSAGSWSTTIYVRSI